MQFRSFLGTVFFIPEDKIREDENFILARKKKSIAEGVVHATITRRIRSTESKCTIKN